MSGVWTEHRAPDGSKYFYNMRTKKSTWTLPAGVAAMPSYAFAQPQAAPISMSPTEIKPLSAETEVAEAQPPVEAVSAGPKSP
jgi:hypothetical protein